MAPWVVPGATPARHFLDRSRLLPTIVVAGVIAAVVLGGIGLDTTLAAPSAGTISLNVPVQLTAAPGWVLVPPDGSADVIRTLQKGDARMAAWGGNTGGESASQLLADLKDGMSRSSADIRFGDVHVGSIGGHEAALVSFLAVATGKHGSATIDGELVCMIVGGYAVAIEAYAPQGDLDPVTDDIVAMLNSVEAAR
jgi:hypothetical protein